MKMQHGIFVLACSAAGLVVCKVLPPSPESKEMCLFLKISTHFALNDSRKEFTETVDEDDR